MQNHMATAANGGPSLILVRETWSWMSEVSGFDPLCSAIERLPGLDTKSVRIFQNLPRFGLARRLVRRIRRPSPLPCAVSLYGAASRSRWTCAALGDLGCAKALAFLSAGENQYGGILSHAAASVRSRLVICFHLPPSWWRLHWRDPKAA